MAASQKDFHLLTKPMRPATRETRVRKPPHERPLGGSGGREHCPGNAIPRPLPRLAGWCARGSCRVSSPGYLPNSVAHTRFLETFNSVPQVRGPHLHFRVKRSYLRGGGTDTSFCTHSVLHTDTSFCTASWMDAQLPLKMV